ncbi:MAG TPA: helix-turn-helix domain-containing protein [Thermoanaerobaculia bacterium]|nr:helix-turn-helix domain-containing protein [Thermoanaerobaculia bacterium]
MPKLLPTLGVALTNLRRDLGWSLGELADALGISPNQLSDLERGSRTLTPEKLEEYAAPMRVPQEIIREVVAQVERVRSRAGVPLYPSKLGEVDAERGRIESVVRAMADATAQIGRPLLANLSMQIRAIADRQWAQGAWERLRRRPPADRRSLVRKSRECRGWAVCELACEDSLKAAPDSAARALEYAELAVEIARLPAGENDLFRRRLQGYAEAHLGNARRVHGDLRGADEAFVRARSLWKEGAPGEPGLLNEARVLGLESSLRIEQGRPTDALKLIAQALEADRNGERRYLLINQGRALEHLGDYDGAIAAHQRAAPLIDGRKEPRQLAVLQSNLIQNLCHLRRFAEAEALLPELRGLVEGLGQELDLLRTLWVEGWVAAGLGRRKEAIAALEHVSREFAQRQIPFYAALAGLELAVLYLEEGRTVEVRKLANELLAIFKAQKVRREASAALTLFCKAAAKETATADLARRLGDFLYRAQHNPELRFDTL